ncbi:porin [Rhizobium rhizosphaerae]|uniref:Porin n=1 Tax=Xaviernesmea rhizosphaerae TaxID=1672749 RepID=A0ABX3PAR9_9HYPH|nr:porin [Xaviernesmea rhizosphaerae]OQP84960.1 porin [Xaviernesmea rhizosphaerae]
MMKFALLANVAAISLFAGSAFAADAIVAASPEPMSYVRVCDAFGKGYFYIPGTETCLKVGGYVRFDSINGESPYDGINRGWAPHTRATLRFDAASDTEYGELHGFMEHRYDVQNGDSKFTLVSTYIELGGFRAGYSDSRFDKWLDSAGNVVNDDVIDYSPPRTNQISYVYKGANGFSALVGLEEGNGSYKTGDAAEPTGYYRANDWPHTLAGLKLKQDWGGLSLIGGYDTEAETFAGKARLDLTLTKAFSIFVMGGYQSDWDNERGPGNTRMRNFFASWNGDWAVWSGFTAKMTPKASLNGQVAYEEDGTFASALNVKYAVASGLSLQPELTYTKFHGLRGDGDAFGGTIRLQRDF